MSIGPKTGSLCVAMAGAVFVWYAPLMLILVSDKSPVPMTTSGTSWLVSSFEGGCFLSTIPAGILADKIGRKFPLLICGPFCALSFLLLAYTCSVPVLFVIRQVHGIILGVAYTIAPIYVAEVSEPCLRGFNSSNILTMYYLGGLFSYCIGPYVNYETYALASITLPLIFFLSFIYMPESPYYLLMKERFDDAKKALSWLRGDKDVEEELEVMYRNVLMETKNKGSWRELLYTKQQRKAFFIVQVCCITKYLGGITAFFLYGSETFGSTTIDYLDPNQLTIASGLILTVSAFSTSFVTDSIGRRPMLIYSCLMCSFFYALTAVYYFLDSKTDFNVKPFVTVLYISIIGFIISSTVGLAPLMQTIQAEYFSASTRGIAGGITLGFSTILVFTTVKLYQFIMDTVGVYLNYAIYALLTLWGSICMYFILPETAGRSLGEIQIEMTKK